MVHLSLLSVRPKFTRKTLVVLVVLLVLYSEFIVYWTLQWTWIEHPACVKPYCKKLLLVSDPQIVGPEWGRMFLMDIIAIWDSDRYIRRTFLTAVKFFKPDMIIFLGDLMDQGYKATKTEFLIYSERLKYIFTLPSKYMDTKIIISPGDNDIGGIEENLLPQNVHRFNNMFNQTEHSILTDFIEFCKVNLMTATLQHSKFINEDIIRVVLSHIPLIPKESYFLKEIVKKIRPHLIFSGHVHTSSHYVTYETDVWSHNHSGIPPTDAKLKKYKFHEGIIHEIIVPTCSYRMGVTDMGYGAATIVSGHPGTKPGEWTSRSAGGRNIRFGVGPSHNEEKLLWWSRLQDIGKAGRLFGLCQLSPKMKFDINHT